MGKVCNIVFIARTNQWIVHVQTGPLHFIVKHKLPKTISTSLR